MLGHEAAVNSVTFSPDGTRILSGSEDKKVRLWNAHTGEPIEPLLDTVERVAFSPDGTRIVSRSKDNQVTFSPPDSKRIVFISDDNIIRLWEISTSQPAVELTGHGEAVDAVAFSPNGELILSASVDKTDGEVSETAAQPKPSPRVLRLWNTSTGEPIGE